MVEQALNEEGHHVHALTDGLSAQEHLLSMSYSLAVLDLMLPGCSGFDVIESMREARSATPILVLSACDAMPDIVRALDLGADDYLTKPFHLDMLLARVRSVSRRGPIREQPKLTAGGLVLNPGRHEVTRDHVTIALTRREFALLEVLMRRVHTVTTHQQLLDAGWGLLTDTSRNTLEFHIHGLRSKIDLPGDASLIRSVRGMGYRFGS